MIHCPNENQWPVFPWPIPDGESHFSTAFILKGGKRDRVVIFSCFDVQPENVLQSEVVVWVRHPIPYGQSIHVVVRLQKAFHLCWGDLIQGSSPVPQFPLQTKD